MIELASNHQAVGVDAIAAPCSARKQKPPLNGLRATSLPRSNQASATKAWLDRLTHIEEPDLSPARNLYSGRSFRRVREVARLLNCRLYVVSAGLGLVESGTAVPSYDLTLSDSGPGSLARRITHAPRPSEWWSNLEASPYAIPLEMACVGHARILVALTRPYANMVAPALAKLPASQRSRLRILGFGLARAFPELREQLIHYDDRLNQLTPGTRSDGASRALEHFAKLVASRPVSNVYDDQRLVDASLSHVAHRTLPDRTRVCDAELAEHAARLSRKGLSASAALKQLRMEAHIACEERRFRRLFEEARR
jgi:hypothetical protein